jgi:hypothetical protein
MFFLYIYSAVQGSTARYRRVVNDFLTVDVLLSDNTFSSFSSSLLFAFRAAFHAAYRFFSRSFAMATNVIGLIDAFSVCFNEILGFFGT